MRPSTRLLLSGSACVAPLRLAWLPRGRNAVLDDGSHPHMDQPFQMKLSQIHNRSLAILIARVILGLIFFMAGQWKLFSLGPLGHARRWFVGPYAETFLPMWSLWATGTVVPFVEFVAGALLLVGLWTRPALAALGGVLIVSGG